MGGKADDVLDPKPVAYALQTMIVLAVVEGFSKVLSLSRKLLGPVSIYSRCHRRRMGKF